MKKEDCFSYSNVVSCQSARLAQVIHTQEDRRVFRFLRRAGTVMVIKTSYWELLFSSLKCWWRNRKLTLAKRLVLLAEKLGWETEE